MNKAYSSTVGLRELLDDRVKDGVFRIDPRAFTDAEIFELELAQIFESTWIFLGLESEVPKPNDFVVRNIGRRSVILQRDGNGELHCFLNSCRHRGTTLCPVNKGNRKLHVCRYHGWSYETNGRCVGITYREDGQYPESFQQSDNNLQTVAAFDSYRGFVFASLSADVPRLTEHLGDARSLLDLIADFFHPLFVDFIH